MTGMVLVHKLEVALCIVPQHPGVTDEEISINPDLGFFRIPVQTSPAQIYRYIQVHRQNVSLSPSLLWAFPGSSKPGDCDTGRTFFKGDDAGDIN